MYKAFTIADVTLDLIESTKPDPKFIHIGHAAGNNFEACLAHANPRRQIPFRLLPQFYILGGMNYHLLNPIRYDNDCDYDIFLIAPQMSRSAVAALLVEQIKLIIESNYLKWAWQLKIEILDTMISITINKQEIQIILYRYETIEELFNNIDLTATQILYNYDANQFYFTMAFYHAFTMSKQILDTTLRRNNYEERLYKYWMKRSMGIIIPLYDVIFPITVNNLTIYGPRVIYYDKPSLPPQKSFYASKKAQIISVDDINVRFIRKNVILCKMRPGKMYINCAMSIESYVRGYYPLDFPKKPCHCHDVIAAYRAKCGCLTEKIIKYDDPRNNIAIRFGLPITLENIQKLKYPKYFLDYVLRLPIEQYLNIISVLYDMNMSIKINNMENLFIKLGRHDNFTTLLNVMTTRQNCASNDFIINYLLSHESIYNNWGCQYGIVIWHELHNIKLSRITILSAMTNKEIMQYLNPDIVHKLMSTDLLPDIQKKCCFCLSTNNLRLVNGVFICTNHQLHI